MAVDVGSAVGYLDLDISGFLKSLRSAQDEADSTSKNIASKLGSEFSNFGKSLTSVGTTLTKKVTVPLLGVGAAGLKVATNFEKGMSEVKAISGATGEEFEALRDKAIELGGSTAFSANEVAAAMTEMAKAGWNSQQIIDGMGGVLDAAAASGESLATTSTIVADAITGFGLEAKESTRIADLLTQAANSGTIGIADLGESFKYIAPVAGSMGLSVEDVTTALSAMSMAGIKGSQAGTSLRGVLTRMVKPTDDVAVAMSELGITIANQDGSFKSLDTIVGEMRSSFGGLTEEQKTYYAAVLAGQEGVSGLLSLLNLTEEEYNEIAVSMDNAGGVAANTAAIMQDNLQSKVEQFLGSLESLAIKLADYVIPYLRQFVEWITSLVDKFTALDPETQKTILKFAGLAAAIGPVIAILGKVVSGVGSVMTAFGTLSGGFQAVSAGGTAGAGALAKVGGALAGITAPMVAVTAGIGLLIAAFTSLWQNNEEFRTKVTEIWNQVKSTFESFTQGIVERLNSLGFDFESITEVLKAAWEGFCNFLAPIFEGVFQYIADTFDVITGVILGVMDLFISIFKGDWEGAWDAIKGIFETIWNGIKDFFQNVCDTLSGILDVVCGWFDTTWSDTWNSIKTFFENTWNNISSWFETTLNNISSSFQDIWNGVSSFFESIWNGISSFFTNTINGIKSTSEDVWNNISSFVSTTWEAIQSTISTVINAIWSTITTIWNGIKETISTAIDNISTVLTDVWNAISSTITNVVEAIKTKVTDVWNGIKDTVSNVTDGIKTGVTNAWDNIKTSVGDTVDGIKKKIGDVWDGITTKVSTVVDGVKTKVTGVFDGMKTKVGDIFEGIKTSITDKIQSAKDTVGGIVDNIVGFFTGAKFSWPSIPLPHFGISPSGWKVGDLLSGSIPKLSISWYKKAMTNGMVLDKPTIFGFDSSTGSFLAGGEAGSETVVGTKNLLSMIKRAVNSAITPLIAMSRELASATMELGYVTYNGFTKLKEAKEIQDRMNQGTGSNGDTFVFYSPKAIDEIEAAKQMKKTKRELAEGF